MTMVAPILDPDTRIFICPTDEEEGQTRFRGKETEIYCLPERDSSEDLTSNAELMEAIKEVTPIMPVTIVVKLHPYERVEDFASTIESHQSTANLWVEMIPGCERPHPWVMGADLVVGIGSVLLTEAMVLGVPVVSVQPGLCRENTFVPGAAGFGETWVDSSNARLRLTELLMNPNERRELLERNRGFVETFRNHDCETVAQWWRQFGGMT